MNKDFHPAREKFTMLLADDHLRYSKNPPKYAFTDILCGIYRNGENVELNFGSGSIRKLLELLRKEGCLPINFPEPTEFMKMFGNPKRQGWRWRISSNDPWKTFHLRDSESTFPEEIRIPYSLFRFLVEMNFDDQLSRFDSNQRDIYFNFVSEFDTQCTFFPPNDNDPAKVKFFFRYSSEGFRSAYMRSMGEYLGMVPYYGDRVLFEDNEWERRENESRDNAILSIDEIFKSNSSNGYSEQTPIVEIPWEELLYWARTADGDLEALIESIPGLDNDEREELTLQTRLLRVQYVELPIKADFAKALHAFGKTLEGESDG